MFCGLLASGVAIAADIPWVGPAGGEFTDPANWDGGVFPTTADVAVLGAGTAVFNTGADVTVSSLTSTSGSLSISSGTLNLTGNTGQLNFGNGGGAFAMTGGNFVMNNAFVYRIGASNSVATTFNMSGGSQMTSTGGTFFVIGNGLLNGGITDGARINSTAAEFYLGDSAGTVNFTMAGGSQINSTGGNFHIGKNGATTTVTMSAAAVINSSGSSLNLANGTNATGNLTLTGGSAVNVTAGEFRLAGGGANTTANLVLEDSGRITMTDSESVWAASANSTANVTLSDTSSFTGVKVKIGDTGNTTDGANSSLTLNGTSTFTVDELTLGHLAGAGNATVTVNSGTTLTASTFLTFGRDDSDDGGAMAGVLNINGGTVAVGAFRLGGGTGAHSINVNGGTIQALSNTQDFFIDASPSAASTLSVNIGSGGMTFDTNSFDVNFNQDIAGAGGVTKTGLGNLSVTTALSYTGATTITTGNFIISETGSLASSLVSLAGDTTFTIGNVSGLTGLTSLELAAGAAVELFYDGNMTLASLSIDGEEVAAGTYTSGELTALGTSSDVTFSSGAFNGTVTVIPEPGSLALTAVAGLLLMRRTRRA